MKLYMYPTLAQVKDNAGIGRVVIEQHRRLPAYGFEFISDHARADLVIGHVNAEWLPRVDVMISHGLYFQDVPHQPYINTHHEVNRRIAETARKALAITVPSNWVAEPFKRDMRLVPTVIPHGIDLDVWHPDKKSREPFLLWNKNRGSDVCDPAPAYFLAERGAQVITTFAPAGKPALPNLQATGALPFAQMKQLIEQSTIYLATTLETFGIGTLEALAAGTPVLGYRWGGTADIVEHKASGYLVDPEDQEGLIEGLNWLLENWPMASEAARMRAEEFSWERAMEKYAALFQDTYEKRQQETGRVSVVITNYNYAQWVGQAIESVLPQLTEGDELIVIDDGSTDNSREVLQPYTKTKAQIYYTENQGVAAARNLGLSLAHNPFVTCLDADDRLHPNFIEVMRAELAKDRQIGVVYCGLKFYDENDNLLRTWKPPAEFDWNYQTRPVKKRDEPPSTVIPTPSACMFRKTVWERSGGYHQQYAPGEDTEFWVRALAHGFTAQPVRADVHTLYRQHAQGASKTKTYGRIDTWKPWMRDRQMPFAAPMNTFPVVRSYLTPLVSILISVGTKHVNFIPSALESVSGQTLRSWEVIILDDTEHGIPDRILAPYPFVKVYRTDKRGVSGARNLALEKAKAPLCLFLDVDDYLHPEALQRLVVKYTESDGRYIYSDAIGVYQNGEEKRLDFLDYNPHLYFDKNLHAITALLETEQARKLAFNPNMRGFEDWDFYLRAAITGYHGTRLAEPLLYIRRETGHFQDLDTAERKAYREEYIQKHYAKYKEKPMPCGSCGNGGKVIMAAKQVFREQSAGPVASATDGPVRMQFIGQERGAITIHVNGRAYRGANSDLHRFANVNPADVEKLEATGKWQRVQREVIQAIPANQAPPPAPINWPAPVSPVVTPEKQAQATQEPLPAYQPSPVEVAVNQPANQKKLTGDENITGAEVLKMSVRQIQDAVKDADKGVLLGWLQAEQDAENPRSSAVKAIETAIDKLLQ